MGRHSMSDDGPLFATYKSIGERSEPVGSQSMSYPDRVVSVETGEHTDGVGMTARLQSLTASYAQIRANAEPRDTQAGD
jgi:hypothetical protein